jgi:hypothetical protein
MKILQLIQKLLSKLSVINPVKIQKYRTRKRRKINNQAGWMELGAERQT